MVKYVSQTCSLRCFGLNLLGAGQSPMLNLLLTVVVTIIRGIPLMMVLAVVVLCYSLVGVILFSNLRSGEAVDYK